MNELRISPGRCQFCHRTGDDVEQLVAGDSAYICNDCIEACHALLQPVDSAPAAVEPIERHLFQRLARHFEPARPSDLIAMLVERRGALVRSRGADGSWQNVHERLSGFDSMLSQLADPRSTPELLALREQIRSWRFYDHFRTDAAAPARMPQIGTHTPVLGHDGADLAAALQTIREIGDGQALDEAIDDAFPGARVEIESPDGRFETTMHQHGLLRRLKAVELSDGTLRYLLWIAALLSPRPPELLVLNEPETSLHPDLLPALGRLIAHASKNSQLFVVSHASRLIATLESLDCHPLTLEKELGETRALGRSELDRPAWHWPSR